MHFFPFSAEVIMYTGHNANSSAFVFSSLAPWHSFCLLCQDNKNAPVMAMEMCTDHPSGGPQSLFVAYFTREHIPHFFLFTCKLAVLKTTRKDRFYLALNSWLPLLLAVTLLLVIMSRTTPYGSSRQPMLLKTRRLISLDMSSTSH